MVNGFWAVRGALFCTLKKLRMTTQEVQHNQVQRDLSNQSSVASSLQGQFKFKGPLYSVKRIGFMRLYFLSTINSKQDIFALYSTTCRPQGVSAHPTPAPRRPERRLIYVPTLALEQASISKDLNRECQIGWVKNEAVMMMSWNWWRRSDACTLQLPDILE